MLCLLPAYALRMWRRGGYRQDFVHRFGCMGAVPPKRPGVRRIWLQAVSVGELLAVGPMLEQLACDSSIEVYLTTTTSTGRQLAESKYARFTAWRGIFPLDWAPFQSRAWKRLQPDLIILMESEIWPEHLHRAQQNGVPVVLLNGRLSDRSFRRYRACRAIVRPLLKPLTVVLAGTEQDRERFAALGLEGVSIRNGGNMKFDVAANSLLSPLERSALRAEAGAGPDDLILLGASTWPGEEEMVATAAAAARAQGLPVQTIIVPRHAERRAAVAEVLGDRWGKVHFRTDHHQAPSATDIYVADTTGELARFVEIADLVFVGKTMPPHTEGQTPIEAASRGCPILLGPGTGNFRQIVSSLIQAGAARRVLTPAEFVSATVELLQNPEARRRMGTAGTELQRRHQGATAIAVDTLKRFLPTAN